MSEEKMITQCQQCGRKGKLVLFGKYCPHCNSNTCKVMNEQTEDELPPEELYSGNSDDLGY